MDLLVNFVEALLVEARFELHGRGFGDGRHYYRITIFL
jgi:hypothetical protein